MEPHGHAIGTARPRALARAARDTLRRDRHAALCRSGRDDENAADHLSGLAADIRAFHRDGSCDDPADPVAGQAASPTDAALAAASDPCVPFRHRFFDVLRGFPVHGVGRGQHHLFLGAAHHRALRGGVPARNDRLASRDRLGGGVCGRAHRDEPGGREFFPCCGPASALCRDLCDFPDHRPSDWRSGEHADRWTLYPDICRALDLADGLAGQSGDRHHSGDLSPALGITAQGA